MPIKKRLKLTSQVGIDRADVLPFDPIQPSNQFTVRLFGCNQDVDAKEDWQGMWTNSSPFEFPTTAETLNVDATVPPDGVGNEGAQTVIVQGLDQDWNLVQDEMEISPVMATTLHTFRRVYRAVVDRVGEYGTTNAGDIIITNSGSGQTLGHIAAGAGSTEQAIYTVPKGHTAFLLEWSVNPGDDKMSFRLMARPRADNIDEEQKGTLVIERLDSLRAPFDFHFEPAPVRFPEYTDIWMEVRSEQGNNKTADGEFEIMVVKNDLLVRELNN